jgi:nitroreductase
LSDILPAILGVEPLPQAASPETLGFLALRRSTSALNLTAPGPDAGQLSDLLRLAVRVPDHGKLSPWRFIILSGEAKALFAERLDGLAQARGDAKASAKLGKLKAPPLCVAVVFGRRVSDIPVWEQQLSAGAVCTTLLYAAQAMGFGANWITDWYAVDPEARAVLGVSESETVAGFVMIGSAKEPALERERPAIDPLVSTWPSRA